MSKTELFQRYERACDFNRPVVDEKIKHFVQLHYRSLELEPKPLLKATSFRAVGAAGVGQVGSVGYRNVDEGFFAGISYGVLFPLGALDHPAALFPGIGESGSAEAAQTIQSRLVLTF